MVVKLMKRILIVALLIQVASLLALVAGAYELSLVLVKSGATIGLAVFIVYFTTLIIKEW